GGLLAGCATQFLKPALSLALADAAQRCDGFHLGGAWRPPFLLPAVDGVAGDAGQQAKVLGAEAEFGAQGDQALSRDAVLLALAGLGLGPGTLGGAPQLRQFALLLLDLLLQRGQLLALRARAGLKRPDQLAHNLFGQPRDFVF